MLRMIVVVLKLSLLVVVGMCKSASSSIRHRSDPTPWISTDSLFNAFPYRESDKELRPITFLVPFTKFEGIWKVLDIGLVLKDSLSKDEITEIDSYLITHPVVNRKLLKAYLNLRLYTDGELKTQEDVKEYEELVKKRNLEFVDTLFEELAEQLPLTKKEKFKSEVVTMMNELRFEMAACQRNGCERPNFSLPGFIEEFFETTDIGLTEKELSNISKHLLNNPQNRPMKRWIYEDILNDRLYFDNLLQKIGKKGLRKQENRRKLKEHRIQTIRSIIIGLSFIGRQPNMKKYGNKIQKHLSQNVN